jgi:polygalacturonase
MRIAIAIIIGTAFSTAPLLFFEATATMTAPQAAEASTLVAEDKGLKSDRALTNDAAAVQSPSDGAQECIETSTSTRVVSVKDTGAAGDGRSDDTAAIQAAIDKIAGTGGAVLVPDGTYLVDAAGKNRLSLKSNMTLKLSDRATLKAIANDSSSYAVLSISGQSNVAVIGGTLEGDRREHLGKSGQWGLGIRIDRGARHVVVSGVTSKEMWGDGFYVQGAADVKFCGVIADNNRRQGLSIIEVDRLVVTNSAFKNTQGTLPAAGIDLEPDRATHQITNVRISNSRFIDNAGAGIQIGGRGRISNVDITRNVIKGSYYAGVLTDGTEGRISDVAIAHNVLHIASGQKPFSDNRVHRPISINNAPAILASAICGNRFVESFVVVDWLREERPCAG